MNGRGMEVMRMWKERKKRKKENPAPARNSFSLSKKDKKKGGSGDGEAKPALFGGNIRNEDNTMRYEARTRKAQHNTNTAVQDRQAGLQTRPGQARHDRTRQDGVPFFALSRTPSNQARS